jgi:hypothetical protein
MEEKMAKRIVHLSFCLAMIWIVSASVLSTHVDAQDTTNQTEVAKEPLIDFSVLTVQIVESIIYSIIGLIVLVVGYKIFDLVTPYDLNYQIAEDNNTAAGVAVAGILIALGLIVSAAIG